MSILLYWIIVPLVYIFVLTTLLLLLRKIYYKLGIDINEYTLEGKDIYFIICCAVSGILFLIGPPIIISTLVGIWGVGPEWKEGTINMRITDSFQRTGVMFETYHVRGYEGENEMLKTIEVSSFDPSIKEQTDRLLNKRVIIHYNVWYKSPWWVDANHIQKIEVVDE